MKVLNLVYPEKSDIKYEISRFPDGQQQVKIILLNGSWLSKINNNTGITLSIGIQIKARLNNFKDLELIICATKSLRELGVKEIHLYTPYFLGSRSDRKFEEGSNNYLKDVICPIINSLKFKSVTVLDPHSFSLECCLDNFNKIDNLELVDWATNEIAKSEGRPKKLDNLLIVSPDTGASKKIYKLAEQIGYTGEIITCSKSRDIQGKLSKTVVPFNIEAGENINQKDVIIVDDICDGGRTFINIAKEIKEYERLGFAKKINIYLIVTHGIFSAGFEELNKYFDGIYCTNSYSDISELLGNDLIKTNVKQLNIFE